MYDRELLLEEIQRNYWNGIGNHTRLGAEETAITIPTVTVDSPTNTTYPTSSVWFNVTLDNTGDWCGYSLNGNSNVTMDGSGTSFYKENASMIEDYHNVTFSCNSTGGDMNSSVPYTYFTVDFPPIIIIESPTNTSYGTSSIWFNVTLNEVGDWCGYSLDGSDNTTMSNTSGNWNNLNSTMSEGSHEAVFYCNDSVGNMNNTNIIFTVDLSPPYITINQPPEANTSINWFNVTAYDDITDIDVCWYSIDGGSTNQTMDNTSGNWNHQDGGLLEGSYTATYWCNDSVGNENSTTRDFVYDISYPVCTWISQTPTNLNSSSKGQISIIYNCTDVSWTNNTRIGLANGYNQTDGNTNSSTRFPSNTKAGGCCNELRACHRNESNWFEEIFDDIYTWGFHDVEDVGHVSIIDSGIYSGGYYTTFNFTKLQLKGLFYDSYPLDKSELEGSTPRELLFYKDQSVISELHINSIKTNTSIVVYDYIDDQSSPKDGVGYFCNSTFKNDGLTYDVSPNCVFFGSVNRLDDYEYSKGDIKYHEYVGFIDENKMISGVVVTRVSYIVRTSAAIIGSAWKSYYSDNTTLVGNISLNNTGLLFTSSDDGITFDEHNGSAMLWFSMTKDSDTLNETIMYKFYSCDNVDTNNCGWSEISYKVLNVAGQPPNSPYVTHIDGDYDKNGSYRATILIGTLLGLDIEGQIVTGDLSLTDTDGLVVYIINGSFTNGNVEINISFDTTEVADGLYKLNLTNCDTDSECSSFLLGTNFTIDNTLPTITIESPENTTYGASNIWFNVTVNEEASWCQYSLDGSNNVTMTNSSGNWNHENTTMTNGVREVIFYCSDITGNINSSSVIFAVDLEPPIMTIESPTNTTYNTKTVWFNVTAYDILNETNWCGYSLDGGTNITMTNSSGNWNAQNTSMWDQYHEVTFYCNDSYGYINSESVGFTSMYENVTRCAILNAEYRTYYLQNDILDYGTTNIETRCMQITAEHIIFDGNGHKMEERTSYPPGHSYRHYGIHSMAINSTVKNFILSNWTTSGIYMRNNGNTLTNITSTLSGIGIHLHISSGNTIDNCTTNSNTYGVFVGQYSSSNSITNVTSNSNSNSGFYIGYDSAYNVFNDCITNTNGHGFYIYANSDSNTIKGTMIENNTNYGMFFDEFVGSYPSNNYIYNNLFNNTNNYGDDYSPSSLYFNTTQQSGTRIHSSGNYIGGNYWTNSTGDGYSDTCVDADFDGFCDTTYTVDTGVYDYLPYSDVYGYINIILPENITYGTKDLTLNWTSTATISDANYSLNGYNNITLMDGVDIKNVSLNESRILTGINNVTIFIENGDGDAYQLTRYFSLDSTPPTWRNLTYDDLAILNYDNTITINVTDVHCVCNVTVEHDGTNYTGTNISDMWTIIYNISSVGNVTDTVWMTDVADNINSTTFTYHGADINITYANSSKPYMMPNATGYTGMYPMEHQPPITIFYNNGNGSNIYVNVTINTSVNSCLEFYLNNETLSTNSVRYQADKFTSPTTTSTVVESMSNSSNVTIYGWCRFINCVSGSSYYYDYWFDFYNV